MPSSITCCRSLATGESGCARFAPTTTFPASTPWSTSGRRQTGMSARRSTSSGSCSRGTSRSSPHPDRLRVRRSSVPEGLPGYRQCGDALRPGPAAGHLSAGHDRAARGHAAGIARRKLCRRSGVQRQRLNGCFCQHCRAGRLLAAVRGGTTTRRGATATKADVSNADGDDDDGRDPQLHDELWSAAPGGPRGTASRARARRRSHTARRSAHRPPASRHRKARRAENLHSKRALHGSARLRVHAIQRARVRDGDRAAAGSGGASAGAVHPGAVRRDHAPPEPFAVAGHARPRHRGDDAVPLLLSRTRGSFRLLRGGVRGADARRLLPSRRRVSGSAR